MNLVTRILLALKIIRLTPDNVDKWTRKGRIDMLEYALKNGMFYTRARAAQALGDLRSKSSLQLLEDCIDDPIRRVSLAAMASIERIELTPDIRKRIKQKREYWVEQIKKEEAMKSKFLSSGKTLEWNRPGKQNLDNLKNLLRKPMNTGKWF